MLQQFLPVIGMVVVIVGVVNYNVEQLLKFPYWKFVFEDLVVVCNDAPDSKLLNIVFELMLQMYKNFVSSF